MSSLLCMVSAVPLQDGQKPQGSAQFQLHRDAWCSASALRGYEAVLSFRPCLSHHRSPATSLPDFSVFGFNVILFKYVLCIIKYMQLFLIMRMYVSLWVGICT